MKNLKELLQSEALPTFEIKAETEEEEYQKFLMDIIAQIVKLRIERGMTQTELAKKAGLKQSAVSRFENLGTNPTIKFLYKFLKALDGRIAIYPKEKGKKGREIHINLIKPNQSTVEEYEIDVENGKWRETKIWKVPEAS